MRGVKKENLPSKICVTCGRPFTWRKKWERVWDEVTTCSKSCNSKRRLANRGKKGENTDDKANHVVFERRRPGEPSAPSTNSPSEERPVSIIQADRLSVPKGAHEEEVSLVKDVVFSDKFEHLETLEDSEGDTAAIRKAQRKAEKKVKKAERRAQREGRGDPHAGQKQCDMCGKSVNLLVRCMYEPNQYDWKMVCGKCWNVASGGVVDGDADHPHYRYGGLWKNRRQQG